MQRTSIAYLTHTWNPLAMRCTPVSEACENCWHIAMAKRHAANPHFTEDERAAYAGHNIVLREKELEAPLKLRKPARIGVQFMGDLFLEGVGLHWQVNVWRTMADSPRHSFLVLTKRPKLMEQRLRPLVQTFGVLPNVWLGTTVENGKRRDERVPFLLACRDMAAGLWLSVEPMLESGNFRIALDASPSVDWVVCGAESGAGARYMNPNWAENLLFQCLYTDTPFFMKQMSNKAPIPAGLMVREYPEGMVQ